jgi:hypothetical protein
MAKDSYDGRGYWATQIIVSLLFGVGGIAYGTAVFVTDFDPDKSHGVIGILIGVAFLATLVWLVRSYRRSGRVGRAVYAWAIMQQHRYSHGSSDVEKVGATAMNMHVAARARDGKLTLDELRELQAMRPEVPYPGEWPSR